MAPDVHSDDLDIYCEVFDDMPNICRLLNILFQASNQIHFEMEHLFELKKIFMVLFWLEIDFNKLYVL